MHRRHFLIGLAALPAVWTVRRTLRNTVTITNGSGQSVHDLLVDVCEEEFRFVSLSPGESASVRFGTPPDESCFVVRGRYADGRLLADTNGYVVWEDYGSTFRLVIRPNGMVDSVV